MSTNTSDQSSDHLPAFVNDKIDVLRETLATGELQLDQGHGIDGESFMNEMIG